MRRACVIALAALLTATLLAQQPHYFGTWKYNPAKSSPPGGAHPPDFELVIEAVGENGLNFNFGGMLQSRAQFDGKEYPLTGPVALPGATTSFQREGSRSFRSRAPVGTEMFDWKFTVSEDGQTLIETCDDPRMKGLWVFERVK